jgi:hypothetical protein
VRCRQLCRPDIIIIGVHNILASGTFLEEQQSSSQALQGVSQELLQGSTESEMSMPATMPAYHFRPMIKLPTDERHREFSS